MRKVAISGTDNRMGYLFIAPWLIGFFFITLVPMILSFYFSFTQYDLLSSPVFVGFENYKNLIINDERFHTSLWVTFIFVIVVVPLRLAVSLGIALLLFRDPKGHSLYKTLFYLPSLFGGSVAIAVMWRQLFSSYGPIASFIRLFNPGFEKSIVGSPNTASLTIIILLAWQFGSTMLIFLAGLKNIPKVYYEVSKIDGAGPVTTFFKITFPQLSSVFFFNLILTIINSFMIFSQAYIITEGGPVDKTLYLVLYAFKRGFEYFQMGSSSAITWILLLILSAVIGFFFANSKRWVYYESK
ncbi:MAG: sugar ABC transporter permease [Spirochaetales bacterium]|nr:sugar ABC transporter permease [Spirochaetales bacterium]